MFRQISDFVELYAAERAKTLQLLQAVSQDSLDQRVSADGRTLGFIAWHIASTIPEMMCRTGLKLAKLDGNQAPELIEEIRAAYAQASQELLDAVQAQWTNEDLSMEDDMYGEEWSRSQTLLVLLTHEIHHRAQLTVLMRQAGLPLPGLYGPSREEWAAYGLQPHP